MSRQRNRKFWKRVLLPLMAVLISSTFGLLTVGSASEDTIDHISSERVFSDTLKSDITVPVSQNVTVPISTPTLVEASPLMIPTAVIIDFARGFEPMEPFSGQFNATLARLSNTGNSSLIGVDSRVSLQFDSANRSMAAIAAYNLTFLNRINMSSTDFVSIAFSTDSNYNSSQAYVGVCLLLTDQNGNRQYVSVEVSDRYKNESFEINEWFLGWGFTPELPKYPHYSFKYGSESGSWFRQLSLSQSLSNLSLPWAWLDGFLIGGEIFSRPLPYTLAEMNVTFNYINIHAQPFIMNQQLVNSTVTVCPYTTSLNFSGIIGRNIDVSLRGYLKPSNIQEQTENNTVSDREVLFDLSKAFQAGIILKGNVNITVFSKNVKRCIVTIDEGQTVDLTDELLSSNVVIYAIPQDARVLGVVLTLYRFNSWIFIFSFLDVINLTKRGIVEEYLSPVDSEGVVVVDVSQGFEKIANLAVRVDVLTPRDTIVNGVAKPVQSVLIINEEAYLVIPLVESETNGSQFTIQYALWDRVIYQSFTETPFNVYFNGSFFSILTPFNFEGELGFPIPFTVQMLTFKTFVLQIEYDSSFFETSEDEIMAYSSRSHYEYFMLRPLRVGQSTVTLKINDPLIGRTIVSYTFFASVSSSLLLQTFSYALLIVTVTSLFFASWGKFFERWIHSFGWKHKGNIQRTLFERVTRVPRR